MLGQARRERGADGSRESTAPFLSLADYAADPGRPHPPAIVLGYGASAATSAHADIEQAVAAIAAAAGAT